MCQPLRMFWCGTSRKDSRCFVYSRGMEDRSHMIMQLAMWHEAKHRSEVTVIAQSSQKDSFAVGYADGSVRLWNASSGMVVATFNGHTKAITTLAFDEAGARLASGSQDTTVILWDIIGEVGLFR